MSKERRSTADWWTEHLAQFEADGRKDAESGTYDLPWCRDEDDPQSQDENAAYHRGFTQRRRELGKAFKWWGTK